MHVRLAGISKNRDSLQGPLNTKLWFVDFS
jgi:hypothetical protein